ncbi:cyclase family protein [Paenibacillus sp. 203]|uniref:cyclase family protein n=1 Tax=Paenibacillus sp. 203 TaxID=3096765 RepID=UPI00300A3559
MAEHLVDILKLLKQKEWVDLSHAFYPEIPHFPVFDNVQVDTLFTHDDGFFVKQYCFPGQYGTHIDAPVHFVKGKRYLHELSLKELVLPLVVIDRSAAVAANSDYELTVADILDFEKEHGRIADQSFVAFRSDWSKRWPDSDAFSNKDDAGDAHCPGWSLEALRFLVEERNVAAIGHETLDTDSSVAYRNAGKLAGEYYILEQDRYQVEVLTNLDKLPPTGAVIYNIVPSIQDSPGFPVRSFAILP